MFLKNEKHNMISLLQKYVSLPSVSNNNDGNDELNLAKEIKDTFNGFNIRNTILGDKSTGISVKGTVGFAEKGILFNCPLDTTPEGDPDKWKYAPYDGTIRGGKMYGRETADAKAGMVSMIYAAYALKKFISEDEFRIELVFDGGEQTGEYSGMKQLIKRHALDVEAGIIGYADNTDNEVAIGARGYHRYKFTTKGFAHHTGSRNKKGINAISHAAKVVGYIESIKIPNGDNPLFPFGSRMTVSMIQGGKAINIVPDECSIFVDIRTVPEVTKKDIDRLIESKIIEIKNEVVDIDLDYEYLDGKEGYYLSPEYKIVKSITNARNNLYKSDTLLVANGPAHIGNLLFESNVPVIVRGPIGGNVHGYDEFVEIDSLLKTSELYVNTIINHFNS
ncbi:MAG: M20/M25/M40 family metallo-hydrolase [Candidatus Dojkabacteria bacterium]|nr:M20/M25/M40 family metallo-hydrolase [Candidatus Dojkabacteria bacterium]MDQ7021743.1 M20/M25/M40 family metallo-hydrolase [Candidatus Dojkabacteria bacterium]